MEESLFIVGVGRSGTSLLQSMLAAHPWVCMLPETSFLRRYATKQIYYKKNAGFIRRMKGDQNIARLGFSEIELEKILNQMDIVDCLAIYESITRKYCVKEHPQQFRVMGDKDPKMIEYLPFLRRIFSTKHIIHIIRDPRDILVSKKKAKWSRKRHPILHIFANKVQIELGDDFECRDDIGRYHQVVYEELIKQPEKTLRNLCDKIGIPFEFSMLNDYAKSAEKLVDQSEMSWKKETLGPLISNNIGKWNNELSEWEVALIEKTCEKSFIKGGYITSNSYETLRWWQKITVLSVIFSIDISSYLYKCLRNEKIKRVIKQIKHDI